MVVVKKEKQHITYDAILFSGVAYTISHVILKLSTNYYLTPVNILFAVALYYFLIFYL